MPFNAKTAEFYREQIEFPFFEFHLKGKGSSDAAEGVGLRDRHESVAQARRPGRRRNAKPRTLLLPRPGPSWPRQPPARSRRVGFDEYVSDPAQPVPYIDKIAIGMAAEYMIADQRFAGRRPDVLVYRDGRARQRT